MKIVYDPHYDIRIGWLSTLSRFDGLKFEKVIASLRDVSGVAIESPGGPIGADVIDRFVNDLIKLCLKHKEHILRALEIPRLPFLTQAFLERKVLEPMRWGVAGTLHASRIALDGRARVWNLSGGYHHASPHSMEGFCIYNDVGIATQELIREKLLAADDRILIVDVDAHHGNGNARTFMESSNVEILDIYNADIYPQSEYTRGRVDYSIPLRSGARGNEYLSRLRDALRHMRGGYRIAYIIAGTDVLEPDPLGHLSLTTEDVAEREAMIFEYLRGTETPAVFLCGGGYSKHSAPAIANAIQRLIALQ